MPSLRDVPGSIRDNHTQLIAGFVGAAASSEPSALETALGVTGLFHMARMYMRDFPGGAGGFPSFLRDTAAFTAMYTGDGEGASMSDVYAAVSAYVTSYFDKIVQFQRQFYE